MDNKDDVERKRELVRISRKKRGMTWQERDAYIDRVYEYQMRGFSELDAKRRAMDDYYADLDSRGAAWKL